MKLIKKTVSIVLALGTCLTLLVGCGGSKAEEATVYINTDGEVCLMTELGEKAERSVLADEFYLGEDSYEVYDAFDYDPAAEESAAFMWQSADGKSLYYVAELDSYTGCGSLYRLDLGGKDAQPERITDELCLYASYNGCSWVSVLNSGILYVTSKDEGESLRLYYYDGEESVRLATELYGYEALGDYVIYTTENDDDYTYRLNCRQLDGSGKAAVLAESVLFDEWEDMPAFTIDEKGRVLFFAVEDEYYEEYTLCRHTPGGETEEIVDCYGGLLTDDGAFYGADEGESLWYFDGKDTKLVSDDLYTIGTWADGIIIYQTEESYEEDWYTWFYTDGKDISGTFETDDDCYTQFWGLGNGGKELIFCAEYGIYNSSADYGTEIMSLPLGGSEMQTVIEDVENALFRDGNVYAGVCTDDWGESYDMVGYVDGEYLVFAEDVGYLEYNHIYADGSVLAMDAGAEYDDNTLYLISGGESQRIADDVTYYLRLDDGRILYISDGVMYVWEKGESTYLDEDVALPFCTGADYGISCSYGYGTYNTRFSEAMYW